MCRAVSRGLGLFNQLRNLKPPEETMCWYSALSLPPLICVAVSIWLRRIYFQKFQAALINCPHFDRRRVAQLCIPELLFCIPKQSCWCWGSGAQLRAWFPSLLQSEALVSPGWEQSLQELHFVCESGWMGVEAFFFFKSEARDATAGDNYANVWVRMALCSLTWWALQAWGFFLFFSLSLLKTDTTPLKILELQLMSISDESDP